MLQEELERAPVMSTIERSVSCFGDETRGALLLLLFLLSQIPSSPNIEVLPSTIRTFGIVGRATLRQIHWRREFCVCGRVFLWSRVGGWFNAGFSLSLPVGLSLLAFHP